ncbi:NAD(P)-dependent oxidoreductase [Legionella sp.]|uniref:NAD(P)-dependent oxidoreductase n=1 Tax=Legionella sp. TaxID=459 RepID=UPI003CC46EE7
MNILADATLPGLEHAFPGPFRLTLYHHLDEVNQLISGQDILLCRATLKVTDELLKNHSLRYLATATSGKDHLDDKWLAAQNVQIIDAKSCNARAVADYVVSTLAYLDQYPLIQGNKAGIIGLGNVGTQVAARLQVAGFELLTYDPPKELRQPHVFQSCLLEELYEVDLLCIHAELHDTPPHASRNLLDQQFFANLKPNCVIINAARGGIVNEESLLTSRQTLTYCTDVYLNEPNIDKRIIDKATLCTPHIAGHSLEAKYIAVAMISNSLHQILGLPSPQFAIPEMQHSFDLPHYKSWQKNVLSIYNPIKETVLLKEAINKESAFLKVRKNHKNRHDFHLYINAALDEVSQLVLGG